jgi:ribonuclease HI
MLDTTLNFIQINLQHAKAPTFNISECLGRLKTFITLIQEPYYFYGIKGLSKRYGTMFSKVESGERPRTCIYVSKNINAVLLPKFSSRDLTTIKIKHNDGNGYKEIICCSVYLPYDSDTPPPTRELSEVINYANSSSTPIILGCDANSHNELWGSTNTNNRGTALMEYILSENLIILNRGSRPTFINSIREEVIDISLCSPSIAEEISNWHVLQEDSLSDHQIIQFELKSNHIDPKTYRNRKSTDWNFYKERLIGGFHHLPKEIKTENELDSATKTLTDLLISCFEISCPLKTEKNSKSKSWWTKTLSGLKKASNKAFNKRHRFPSAYKEAHDAYKKAIRNAKRSGWKNECSQTEGITPTARLHKYLSKDPHVQINSLKTESGEYISEDSNILQKLFETHFPGCKPVNNQTDSPDAEILNNCWEFSKKIVNKDSIKWAIASFAPFKSAGPDQIFPALLQNGVDILMEPLIKIFTASLALGYIPKLWRSVRVVFIPKPGKKTYEEAKSFRPISLSSFLLKTLERIIEHYLRSVSLKDKPLHVNQHAYQRGRSAETALHRLLQPVEASFECGEFSLGAFLDVEGAFDNTSFHIIEKALKHHNVNPILINWITKMLYNRIITSELRGSNTTRVPVGGCPQGGILSPLLWNMVADSLLRRLNENGFFSIGFADDFAIITRGRFLGVVSGRMQYAMRIVQEWCVENGLSVNPNKTALLLFTKKRKFKMPKIPKIFNKPLNLLKQTKYLGVIIDDKLSWKQHLESRIQKSCMILGQCRRAIGRTWGLKPKWIHWIYTRVVIPYFLYGSLFWHGRANLHTSRRQMSKLQRLACLSITGVMRSTPTVAMETILNLRPLHILTESHARSTALRLNIKKQWCNRHSFTGHSKIWNKMLLENSNLLMPCDKIASIHLLDRKYNVIFPTRDEWKENNIYSENEIVFYTDGSLKDNLAGAGLYQPRDDLRDFLSLGTDISVFQAEVVAISMAATKCLERDYKNQKILICSDSKAALGALTNWTIESKLVLECRNLLKSVCTSNELTLVWVPGHSQIEGNEIADELARKGSSCLPIGCWPTIPIPYSFHRASVKDWSLKEHTKYWNSVTTCKESKLFNEAASEKKSTYLLSISKSNIRLICSVLTGHCKLNLHLSRMKLVSNPLCSKCQESNESALHFVCDCPFYSRLRYKIFNKFFIEKTQASKLSIQSLLRFITDSERFEETV